MGELACIIMRSEPFSSTEPASFFFVGGGGSQGRRNGGRFKTSSIGDEEGSDLVRDLKINETPPTPISGLINRAYFRFRKLSKNSEDTQSYKNV